MLKIRLERVGRTHEPSFRLVLTDSKTSSKTGRFKEILGSYDPRKSTDSLDVERIRYWLSKGASPTPTIHNLLVKHRILTAKKINVSAKSKKAPIIPVAKETIVEENVVKETPEETSTQEEAPIEDVTIEQAEEVAEEPASVQDSGEAKEKAA